MADDLWETVVLNGMALEVEDIVPCVSGGVPVVRVSMAPCKVPQTVSVFAGFPNPVVAASMLSEPC